MLTNFFVKYHNRVIGVELCFHSQTDYVCYVTIVSYSSRGQVEIEESIGPFAEIKELITLLGKRSPIYITITGKAVISRKILPDSPESLESLFPGLAIDDFYSEVSSSGYTFLTRKKNVSNIVSEFLKIGLKPIRVSLGPIAFELLAPYLNLDSETQHTIIIGRTRLSLIANKIIHFDFLEQPESEEFVSLDSGDKVSSFHLIAYAAALGAFSTIKLGIQNDIPTLTSSESYWKYRIFLRRSIAIFLVFVLCLLSVNGILYLNIYNEYNETKTLYDKNERLILRRDSLEQEIISRNRINGVNGINKSGGGIAIYTDRIVANMPLGLKLNSIVVYPSSIKRSNGITSYRYSGNHIIIKGMGKEEIRLNEWVQKIKLLYFVKTVTINNLNKEIDNNVYFEMDILLK